jgi:hypothetical protein
VILGTTPPGWTAAALAALTIGIPSYGLVVFEAKNEVTFHPYYIEISRAYTVYEAGGGQYKVPFVILYPIIG